MSVIFLLSLLLLLNFLPKFHKEEILAGSYDLLLLLLVSLLNVAVFSTV
jgi:hypothetical protein